MITTENFTRVNNDVNGNPRYVIHFLDVINDTEYYEQTDVTTRFNFALNKMRQFGGQKFRGKQYGGMIVFSEYNLQTLVNNINETL